MTVHVCPACLNKLIEERDSEKPEESLSELLKFSLPHLKLNNEQLSLCSGCVKMLKTIQNSVSNLKRNALKKKKPAKKRRRTRIERTGLIKKRRVPTSRFRLGQASKCRRQSGKRRHHHRSDTSVMARPSLVLPPPVKRPPRVRKVYGLSTTVLYNRKPKRRSKF